MTTRIRAVFAALLVAVLASFAAATPAQAALSDCTNFANTFCLFRYSNAGNPIWRQTSNQIVGCRSLVPDGWNDITTTIRNNNPTYTLQVWNNSNCTGGPVDILYGYTYDFTGNPWDNVVSAVSLRFA